MKIIKYSIVGEDKAHLFFVRNLIAHYITLSECHFEFDKGFHKRFTSFNKQSVYAAYPPLVEAQSKLDPWNLDILIIGMDYDEEPREEYEQRLDKLYLRINEKERKRAVIFFPVKSIEHWMLFLQRKRDNPSLTKNITDEIEAIPNREMKRMVYNSNAPAAESFIADIIANADLAWLSDRSLSFRLFYSRLKEIAGLYVL